MQRPALDQPEGGRVPERCCAAVAERHLVAVGRGEQLNKPRADLADEGLDGLLAMRGAHQRPALAHEALERLRAYLRWPAAETPIDGPQLLGYDQWLLCCKGTRHIGLPRSSSSLRPTRGDLDDREGAQARGGN